MSKKTAILRILFSIIIITTPVTGLANAINQKAWNLVCNKEKKACRVYGHIMADNKIIVSSFSILKLKIKNKKEPKLVGSVILPLGLHIPSGIKIRFDNKVTVKANLIECKTKGCRALFTAEQKIIDQMQKGKTVYITIVDSRSRKKLRLQYSLKGFTKIYKQFVAKK